MRHGIRYKMKKLQRNIASVSLLGDKEISFKQFKTMSDKLCYYQTRFYFFFSKLHLILEFIFVTTSTKLVSHPLGIFFFYLLPELQSIIV